jgi:class 3 adenylate cyclase
MEMHIKKLSKEHTLYKLRTYKLSRYLTPTVWKAISDGNEKSLSTERKRITIFFSDIQGFSALSEELEAETLTEVLNSYLTEMTRIATKHNGTIDKFIGDAVMIIFGDAKSEGIKTDCLRAVSMAIEMRKKMKELHQRWYNQGIKNPLLIRMGINTGFCTVGSFGTSHYMDYTVLGTHVNLASRLESAAEPGEILLSHESWSLVKDVVLCRDKGEITVKGFSHPVRVHQVIDFRKDLGKDQSWFEENTSGFSMHLDIDKVRNYDRKKVLEALKLATEKISEKIINK